MTGEQIRAAVLRVLGSSAPEADLDRLDPDADLRGELDIDPVDSLNFAIGLHEASGVDIPEAGYGARATVDGCVAYVTTGCSVT